MFQILTIMNSSAKKTLKKYSGTIRSNTKRIILHGWMCSVPGGSMPRKKKSGSGWQFLPGSSNGTGRTHADRQTWFLEFLCKLSSKFSHMLSKENDQEKNYKHIFFFYTKESSLWTSLKQANITNLCSYMAI